MIAKSVSNSGKFLKNVDMMNVYISEKHIEFISHDIWNSVV